MCAFYFFPIFIWKLLLWKVRTELLPEGFLSKNALVRIVSLKTMAPCDFSVESVPICRSRNWFLKCISSQSLFLVFIRFSDPFTHCLDNLLYNT
uniref:Secreted protein n=1 Tax=Pyxicephalus adspersus TaxID=30357 RepID=A0AAV3AYN1_PYXAD|nr:TPA: hypothetical protein GDO54_009615 [Pyxicephalus adspersus]